MIAQLKGCALKMLVMRFEPESSELCASDALTAFATDCPDQFATICYEAVCMHPGAIDSTRCSGRHLLRCCGKIMPTADTAESDRH